MREVLEENYGGEYHTANGNPRVSIQKKAPIMRQNSAYMLVYIRQTRVDKILCPVSDDDAPLHLQQKFKEEIELKEARRREQKEAHLYMLVKAITNDTFREYGGTDMCAFDADRETDSSAPYTFRLQRAMSMKAFIEHAAQEMGKDPKLLRPWLMVNRQNRTIRPDQPIMDLSPTIEDVFSKSTAARDSCLRLWIEEAEAVDDDGEPLWQSYASPASTVLVKNDTILLLLKHFDVESQKLQGVGHVYIGKDKKVEELVPLIQKKMGWVGNAEDKLLLWEVITTKISCKTGH
jgi:ubiquitin carboxyl-terminal hydrolase 7